jgi:hypothetical protein
MTAGIFFTCKRVWSLFEEGELNDMSLMIAKKVNKLAFYHPIPAHKQN